MTLGDFDLGGKVIVVTGGGSGICLAFVKLALDAGARVLIADLKLTTEAEKLLHLDPGRVVFMPCDVSDWSQLNAIPEEVMKAFGFTAQVWVAGAGVFEPKWSSWLYDTEGDHYKALSINTEHPMKLTRIALRSCLGANLPGVCLIVSSLAGITGQYGSALYCASKHAVLGFTKSMAQADREEDFKVVCICPGMVSTPLWTGEEAKSVHAQYSFSEDMCIPPEDVAQAMMEMVQRSEYKGGAILGVSKENLRQQLESREAIVVTGPEMQAWADRCYEPVREVFRKERGAVDAEAER